MQVQKSKFVNSVKTRFLLYENSASDTKRGSMYLVLHGTEGFLRDAEYPPLPS